MYIAYVSTMYVYIAYLGQLGHHLAHLLIVSWRSTLELNYQVGRLLVRIELTSRLLGTSSLSQG